MRHAALAAPDRRVLGALGAPRAQRVADVVMPLLPVAIVGALLAVTGAWIASPIMPIGSVRELEVDGGFAFDALVLGAGAALLALLVLAIGAAAAVWSSRSAAGRTGPRTRVSGVPVSVPAGLGVRWALQRTVAWQATVIALLGVLIGLPAGLLLGRYVWASVAHAYGVADDVAWPAFAVIVAIPVTVLIANAIALIPGRRAARIVPAEALRSE